MKWQNGRKWLFEAFCKNLIIKCTLKTSMLTENGDSIFMLLWRVHFMIKFLQNASNSHFLPFCHFMKIAKIYLWHRKDTQNDFENQIWKKKHWKRLSSALLFSPKSFNVKGSKIIDKLTTWFRVNLQRCGNKLEELWPYKEWMSPL